MDEFRADLQELSPQEYLVRKVHFEARRLQKCILKLGTQLTFFY